MESRIRGNQHGGMRLTLDLPKIDRATSVTLDPRHLWFGKYK